jgi:hypothetical protein
MSRHLEKSQKVEKFVKVLGILKPKKIVVLGVKLIKLKCDLKVNINPARVYPGVGLIKLTLHLKS